MATVKTVNLPDVEIQIKDIHGIENTLTLANDEAAELFEALDQVLEDDIEG